MIGFNQQPISLLCVLMTEDSFSKLEDCHYHFTPKSIDFNFLYAMKTVTEYKTDYKTVVFNLLQYLTWLPPPAHSYSLIYSDYGY